MSLTGVVYSILKQTRCIKTSGGKGAKSPGHSEPQAKAKNFDSFIRLSNFDNDPRLVAKATTLEEENKIGQSRI
jgi:hypothetical protein